MKIIVDNSPLKDFKEIKTSFLRFNYVNVIISRCCKTKCTLEEKTPAFWYCIYGKLRMLAMCKIGMRKMRKIGIEILQSKTRIDRGFACETKSRQMVTSFASQYIQRKLTFFSSNFNVIYHDK